MVSNIINKKQTTLFLVLFILNITRHISYFHAYTLTGIYPSISPESIAIFTMQKSALYILEELMLSIIMTLIYFYAPKINFLTYGYLIDPIIDIANSITVVAIKTIVLNNFLIREIILNYLVLGIILKKRYKDIFKIVKEVIIITITLIILQLTIGLLR